MIYIKQFSFLFYDYETFGQHVALDRPAQFASIRTNEDFIIIENPQFFYCIPSNDYIPHPKAVMINGITPQYAIMHGINESEFAKYIHDKFIIPNTCILGFNNINFDDEITRNIFYRNFYNPYDYIWNTGNSRWDLLNVLRAYYVFNSDGINWPINDKGFPSFKLEHLTSMNGIKHINKHDAMADVFATIEIAKLIKFVQPRMFNYFFQLRNKNKIIQLIDTINIKPLIYISGIFGSNRFNTSIIAPLLWHPKNANILIACDLAENITSLLTLNIDQLSLDSNISIMFFLEKKKIPIKLIYINKCPILVPLIKLSENNAQRISLDLDFCFNNLTLIKENGCKIQEILNQLFSQQIFFSQSNNVDTQLYSAFFDQHDNLMMKIIRNTSYKKLNLLNLTFHDARMKKLLFRYRARNYITTLTQKEKNIWLNYRKQIITIEKINQYLDIIKQLHMEYIHDKKKIKQLKELEEYITNII